LGCRNGGREVEATRAFEAAFAFDAGAGAVVWAFFVLAVRLERGSVTRSV